MKHTNETAFESVIESNLLSNGYTLLEKQSYDPHHAIFPEAALDFIRKTQAKEWAKLEALHAEKTGDMVLADLVKWLDTYGSLAVLRNGSQQMGWPTYFQEIIIGLVIIVAVFVDRLRRSPAG